MYLYKSMMVVACCLMMNSVFSVANRPLQKDILAGAWLAETKAGTEVLLFTGGYFSHTAYDVKNRNFKYTYGGFYSIAQNIVIMFVEFDTRDSANVGRSNSIAFTASGSTLQTQMNERQQEWKKLDGADAPLSGVWHITQRMQGGQLQAIHQAGTRKTIKLLTGSRFQWVAVDAGVKGFYGTGGGIYTFENGKYTEQILFLSRDSSRVGARLQFNGQLLDGDWHHSGKSSKGDDIYEMWSKIDTMR